MVPLDGDRLIYSLAGEMRAREWHSVALTIAAEKVLGPAQIFSAGLAGRILRKFPGAPAYAELVAFLLGDARLKRSIKRPGMPAQTMPLKHEQGRMHEPTARLAGLALPRLTTTGALAEWFAMDVGWLEWRADVTGRNRRHPSGPLRQYRYRWIPRKHGAPRLLEIPKFVLKGMQRKILREILEQVPVHAAAHGFCAGRSIRTNAVLHCGKRTVMRLDLADFFASVTSARIFRIFYALGYPPKVARLLTGICTTRMPANVWDARPGARDGADFETRQRLITRHLPQGAPTSPALANLAAHRLDRRLSGLAAAMKATYSRYADDLAFSGDEPLARGQQRLAAQVAVIVREEGFGIQFRKTRCMGAGVRQQVAGVVVNVRPNVRRAEFDRIKAVLTNCLRHGAAGQNRGNHPDFRAHLAGKVAQMSSIHPERGAKLAMLFSRVAWD